MKNTFCFSVVLADVKEISTELEDAVFEAGCDDALLACSGGVVHLDFSREGISYEAAVDSASRAIQAAGYKVKSIRSFDDGLAALA